MSLSNIETPNTGPVANIYVNSVNAKSINIINNENLFSGYIPGNQYLPNDGNYYGLGASGFAALNLSSFCTADTLGNLTFTQTGVYLFNATVQVEFLAGVTTGQLTAVLFNTGGLSNIAYDTITPVGLTNVGLKVTYLLNITDLSHPVYNINVNNGTNAAADAIGGVPGNQVWFQVVRL